jgi:uncharacterized protein YtpQ (UPF0354 family)
MHKQLKQLFGLGSRRRPIRVGDDDIDDSMVMPIVKGTGLSKRRAIQLDLDPINQPFSRPLVGDLVVMYAVDLPDRFEYLSTQVVQEAGLSEQALFALAVANIPTRLSRLQVMQDEPGFRIQADGSLESSLLLYDELWEQFEIVVGSAPLVVVPQRSAIYGAASHTPSGVDYILAKAATFDPEVRYAVSGQVLVRESNSWRPFSN